MGGSGYKINGEANDRKGIHLKEIKMKKILYLLSLTILFLATLTTAIDAQEKRYKIGVFFWHESTNDYMAFEGIEKGFAISGIDHEFDVLKAHGDEKKAEGIIQKLAKEKPDLIYAMGTSATKRLMKVIRDTPIVFTAVTNPVQSGITPNWKTSGRNITGNSNWIPTKEILEEFILAVPTLKTLGVMYYPGNSVSSMEVRLAKEVVKDMGLRLVVVEIKTADDLVSATKSLLDKKVDAIWIPIDIIVYKNLDRIKPITIPAKIPLLASSHRGVREGSMVGVVVDYVSLGRLSVPIAIDILTKKVKPKDIAIGIIPRHRIMVNLGAARDIGYEIPLTFTAIAHEIIGVLSGKIVVTGTGDSQNLLRRLAERFETIYPGTALEVPDSVGSGGGIRAVGEGRAELGRVAREIKEKEKKYGLTYEVFGRSPVVFAVNPSVEGIDNLTSGQIASIYSGKITSWSQLKGGKEYKIYPVDREVGDSSRDVLSKYLPGFKEVRERVAKVVYNTPKAMETLAGHRNTIGYLPLSMTIGSGLKLMKIDGVYPSRENVERGKYKMVLPLGIVYKGELNPLARAFVDFLYSPAGREIITENGCIPVNKE